MKIPAKASAKQPDTENDSEGYELLGLIMQQQETKNPQLAAKQRRL